MKKTFNINDLKSEQLYRKLDIKSGDINEEDRTVSLSFSSETPVRQFFGDEILSHKKNAVDLSRLKTNAPLLLNHLSSDQIGAVVDVKIDTKERKGFATVKFSRSAKAEEIFQDVLDGIRTGISVGYRINDIVLAESVDSEQGERDTYLIKSWQPLEISLASVPADIAVGIGRTLDGVKNNNPNKELIMAVESKKTDPVETSSPEPVKTVDVKHETEKVRQNEISRIREINAIGKQFDNEELASKYIDSGSTVGELRIEIMDGLKDRKVVKQNPNKEVELGLSDKDVQKFSFVRLLNALANPTNAKAQDGAAYELEVGNEYARQSKQVAKGAFVPPEILNRELTVGVPAQAGLLVGTDYRGESFIELLRNNMAMDKAGVSFLPGLVGNVAIPRQITSGSASWITEGGSAAESNLNVDQITLSPKTLSSWSSYSRQLFLQSSPSVEQLIRSDMAIVMALEADRTILHGSGTGAEPLGITNQTGVNTVTFVGLGNPTYDEVVEMETLMDSANALNGSLSYIVNASVRGNLKTQLKAATAGSDYVLEDDKMNGYPVINSNQVEADTVVFGDFSQTLVGTWGALDILVDPYSDATTGGVRIVNFLSMDIAVRHPQSFTVGSGGA